MRNVSNDLINTLNLPTPPVFRLRQDKKLCYKVPDFCGYECSSTRWIIAALTNKKSLRRFLKCARKNEEIFSRYFQIPDRPFELMGREHPHENPAYHMQCVLYLTPLALALYLKKIYSVESMLQLRNESGCKIVHPAEACFVQKVFKKNEKRLTNELYNTFPIIIAIRRGFYEGVTALLEHGYVAQRQISIIYRKPFREAISLFRDILDYLVELLHTKPGLNVTKFTRILLDPFHGLSSYDIFVYDVELDERSNWDYVSIFRRVCTIGYRSKYFIEESATQVLNILEQIQIIGFFGGAEYINAFYNGALPNTVYKEVSEEVANELKSDNLNVLMSKIPTIVKATREDLLNLDKKEMEERVNYDYQCCIGILFLWFQRCLDEENCNQYTKIVLLLSRIILDTKVVEDFFDKSDQELADTFTEWAKDTIKCASVSNFRIKLQDNLLFNDQMCVSFLNRYGIIPTAMIKAPMVHGKSAENSPVIRELLVTYNHSVSEDADEVLDVNQNHRRMVSSMQNIELSENDLPIKFIPANFARNFSQYDDMDLNFDDCSGGRRSNNNLNNVSSVENARPKKIRHKMNKEYLRRRSSSKLSHYTSHCCDHVHKISSDELKSRLRDLLETNEKYHDIKLSESNVKIPIKSLRSDIQKYKSVAKIVKRIQSKEITRMESLYHNLDAIAMMEIMRKLSSNTKMSDLKSLNNEFFRQFKTKF